MVEAGEITLRVLMFPLPSHKGAKEECISVICDEKSFEHLEGRYRSDNQCAKGKALVEETIAFLGGKGITSTPTYIFPDGVFRAGLLQEDALREYLGISGAKSP